MKKTKIILILGVVALFFGVAAIPAGAASSDHRYIGTVKSVSRENGQYCYTPVFVVHWSRLGIFSFNILTEANTYDEQTVCMDDYPSGFFGDDFIFCIY